MQWAGLSQGEMELPVNGVDASARMLAPDILAGQLTAQGTGPGDQLSGATAPGTLGATAGLPTFSPAQGGQQNWFQTELFPTKGSLSVPLSFSANDLQRSASQPANQRKEVDPAALWGNQQSRDTLYAHEFLKAFRARLPDSTEGQAACDYCRRRKIKSNRVCTSDDILRKRGPPSKRERALMDNAGIVFRGRSSRSSKYGSRRSVDKAPKGKPSSSLALANDRFDKAMSALEKNVAGLGEGDSSKPTTWLSNANLWTGINGPDTASIPVNVPPVSMSLPGQNGTPAGLVNAGQLPSNMDLSLVSGLTQNSSLWPNANGLIGGASSLLSMGAAPSSSPMSAGATSTFSPATLPDMSSAPLSAQPLSPFSSVINASGQPQNSVSSTSMAAPGMQATGQDLSLLTKPLGSADEPSPPVDSLGDTRSPTVSGLAIFRQAKSALQSAVAATSRSNLSTRHLIDMCVSNGVASTPPSLGPSSFHLLLPTGSEEALPSDAMCIRVLDAAGDIALRPSHGYFSSPAQLSRRGDLDLELPGGTRVLAGRLNSLSEDIADLFLVQSQWDESDYAKLRADSVTRLQRSPAMTLLRIALKDLSLSLPFLQTSDVETMVQRILLTSSTNMWTPLQVRQHQALLLLLCALGSTLVPAIQVAADATSPPGAVVPWEFGHKCYRLARGLLVPRQGQLQKEEQSLVFVQCMILMHVYLQRCEEPQCAWSALSYGVLACTQLMPDEQGIMAPDAHTTQGISNREMVKRCVWVLFMLEILDRLDNGHIGQRSLQSDAPLVLEAPVMLNMLSLGDGHMDKLVTPEAFSRFVSQTELCQIFASMVKWGLHDSTKPVSAEARSVCDSLKLQLQAWEAQTPCTDRSVPSGCAAGLSGNNWLAAKSLNCLPIYETCALHLARFAMH